MGKQVEHGSHASALILPQTEILKVFRRHAAKFLDTPFAEQERLFITGLWPDEALAFARWLGEGFDLPTLAEWRAIYAALKRAALPPPPPPPAEPLATSLPA